MSRSWTDGQRTEHEDRARILEAEFAIAFLVVPDLQIFLVPLLGGAFVSKFWT